MKQYKGHNAWLNQRPDETNEEYNRRIGEWEKRETDRQYAKMGAYEFLIEILKAELEHDKKRSENIPDRNPDFVKGYRICIDGILKRVEFLKDACEVIGNNPTKYELRWDGGDNYKLGERK